MLKLENIRVQYGKFIAVTNATLEVPQGKIVALIGANGSGKSSLLSAAAKLIPPSAGTIRFRGEDITGLSPSQLVSRGLSLVPQGGRVFPSMSVKDNLLIGSYPGRARPLAAQSLKQVYELFPVLREKQNARAGTLSGGQRQMVAIGRALMARADCILFDEISLGLAPVTIQDLYDGISRINREWKTTIVLVEQDTERALQISEICYVMMKGEITLSGRSSDLTDQQIRDAYFGKR